jgi:protein phosphatase
MTDAARQPANWTLEVGFGCDPGLERDRNEDAIGVFLPYPGEEDRSPVAGLFLVADGMGGHDAGDVASHHVVDRVIGTFTSSEGHSAASDLPSAIEALIRQLHGELRQMATAEAAERGMGSTLALAILHEDVLYLVGIGDSRCYRYRADHLEQLTRDQSWVAEQVRAGLMSEEDAQNHPKRNLLTQCLGIGGTPPIEVRQERVLPGDRFLLCSDGLHGPLPDHVMARVLAEESPQGAATRLVALANQQGGPDNISVIVFQVDPRPDPLAITLPGEAAVAGAATLPMVPRGSNRLSWGLLAAGLLLLAGAVGAWLWFRPAEPAQAATRPVVTPSDSVRPGSPVSGASVPGPKAAASTDSVPANPQPPRGKVP